MEGHSRRWSYRPLAGADEREKKEGCRVVVQGGGCGCRDCWRGKSGREKRYGPRRGRWQGSLGEGRELLFGFFLEKERGASSAGERGAF